MIEKNRNKFQLSFSFDSNENKKIESKVVNLQNYHSCRTTVSKNEMKKAFDTLLKEAKELSW